MAKTLCAALTLLQAASGLAASRRLQFSKSHHHRHNLKIFTEENAADAPQGVCQALRAAAPSGVVRSVAVVGNGPLSYSQAEEANQKDLVIRFNMLNNGFRTDKTSVWVTRYAENAPYYFHGFRQLKMATTEFVLEQAPTLVMLYGLGEVGGSAWYKDQGLAGMAADFPTFSNLTRIRVDGEVLARRFAELVSPEGAPSTGWAGVMMALECFPQEQINVYGFNWSREVWDGHRMPAEEQFIGHYLAAAHPNLLVHAPPCAGRLDCQGCAVIDDRPAGWQFICMKEDRGDHLTDLSYWAETTANVSRRRGENVTIDPEFLIIQDA